MMLPCVLESLYTSMITTNREREREIKTTLLDSLGTAQFMTCAGEPQVFLSNLIYKRSRENTS